MGTLLSFHTRYIYRTNRLLVTVLAALFILQQAQQISCAVIPDSTSLMNLNSTRHIRHSAGRRMLPIMDNQDSRRANSSLRNIHNIADSDSYFGIFSLKSPCSDKYVRIYNDITAVNDHAAQIQFEKIRGTENQFYIRRINARKYVCISRRGKLIVRTHPTTDHRCAFTRLPTESSSLSSQSNNPSIKIQSVAHNSWYIGFKHNGNPMKAWQYAIKGDRCFHLEIQKYSTNSLHKRDTLEQNGSLLETT
ncbi:uncharacterized protein [Watersipora subatra]|uniref:uncharacterized protein n=1 Tax=Watersipora subatra TaxID=2589382 RepID=UPI00355B3D0F